MSTLTLEIQKQSENLSAEIADTEEDLAKLDSQREEVLARLRKHLRGFFNLLEKMGNDLTGVLRRGCVSKDLREILEGAIPLVKSILSIYSTSGSSFQDDSSLATIDSYIRRGNELLDWMQELAKEASKKAPPLDESRLPPDPGALSKGQAPGFIGIADARHKLFE